MAKQRKAPEPVTTHAATSHVRATPNSGPWIPVFRPGALGRNRDAKILAWDQLFGKGRWRLAYRWADRMLSYDDALQLYEDAYLAHLQSQPNLVEWICATASDVYDNAESNVDSGLDYRIQETGATHLQDIAVRRSLMRLGRWFRGRKLLEIRGRQSEGGNLYPGAVPFHRPELILQPEIWSWWDPLSVESFWQSNKILEVHPDVFTGERTLRIHLAVVGPGRTVGVSSNSDGPVQCPTLEYAASRPFDGVVREWLSPWGLEPYQVVPSRHRPDPDAKAVEAVWVASGLGTMAPDGWQFRPLASVVEDLRRQASSPSVANAIPSAAKEMSVALFGPMTE